MILGQKNDHEISEISKAYVGELVSEVRSTPGNSTNISFEA